MSKKIVRADVADSFVYNKIKYESTKGNGEGKLYVGSTADAEMLDEFFNVEKLIIKKENLLEYLNRVFLVYQYQFFGNLRDADASYWREMKSKVDELDSEIEITEDIETFISGHRYYMRLQHEVFQKVIRRIALPLITEIVLIREELEKDLYLELLVKENLEELVKKDFKDLVRDVIYDESEEESYYDFNEIKLPKNRIVFGAPGTGKSFKLEHDRSSFGDNFERVTFHPNYSYAQFVGTYKPLPKRRGEEEYISYEYIIGPFMRVLIKALKNPQKAYLLIIEEINRANVAAVFGDVFQLLDRDSDGKSIYSISVSEELKKYLEEKCNLEGYSDNLKIPANMYMWATMNSADQGVYPMDSAFKRRWSFEYIGIDENSEAINEKTIEIKPYGTINWNIFRKKLNNRLMKSDLNINEDKLIGPFFIGVEELDSDEVNEIIRNKLLIYLYEDVLKHRKGKVFLPQFNTFSKVLKAYDYGENIFDFDVLENEDSFVYENQSITDLVAEDSDEDYGDGSAN